MNQTDPTKPIVPIDESTLSRSERRRLKKNRESGRQSQLERMGFIFARCMEQFRVEARKEFDNKLIEEFIYRAFAPEEQEPTLWERIKLWWVTREDRAKFKAGVADLEKLGKVQTQAQEKKGVTIRVPKEQ